VNDRGIWLDTKTHLLELLDILSLRHGGRLVVLDFGFVLCGGLKNLKGLDETRPEEKKKRFRPSGGPAGGAGAGWAAGEGPRCGCIRVDTGAVTSVHMQYAYKPTVDHAACHRLEANATQHSKLGDVGSTKYTP
jgi:hypothetical protein